MTRCYSSVRVVGACAVSGVSWRTSSKCVITIIIPHLESRKKGRQSTIQIEPREGLVNIPAKC